MSAVDEATPSTVWPVTVRAVAEALVMLARPDTDTLVVDALVILPLVEKNAVAVRAVAEALAKLANPDEEMLVVEAFPSTVCPDTVRAEDEALARTV